MLLQNPWGLVHKVCWNHSKLIKILIKISVCVKLNLFILIIWFKNCTEASVFEVWLWHRSVSPGRNCTFLHQYLLWHFPNDRKQSPKLPWHHGWGKVDLFTQLNSFSRGFLIDSSPYLTVTPWNHSDLINNYICIEGKWNNFPQSSCSWNQCLQLAH